MANLPDNRALLDWVEECRALMTPDEVEWIDASDEQLERLRTKAVATGEMHRLNPELLPGCYYHRSHPTDVARVEDRTFICTTDPAEAGPTNNHMTPEQAKAKVLPLYKGCMTGRTMYVVPYSMGPIGSPFSRIGVELTDSIYVALSMCIMTRAGQAVLDELGDNGDFVRCLHSKGTLSPENRYILHFPEEDAIWSINSGYGGNALQGKKCFALRIASVLGRREGWMAEHMLIVGIENPAGETKYIAAAFPSACGKTNLAMLIPPLLYRDKGYKVWCVGDDIAWLRIGPDGRLYATNPENGFFGVAPGTGEKTNPNALAATRQNTIFTNVVRNLKDNTVWWEGLDKNPPEYGEDWLGNPWNGKTATAKGAQPNSRFTAPLAGCPCVSDRVDDPAGVPISAIVFGGRRARTAPLVFESFDWTHGVFVGSALSSETTAATQGRVGVVRRDPMAMLPFCGYNMGDYFGHWLEMGERLEHKPKIFHVNWFRQDEDGNYLWPGFGDNMRVLEWILARCEDDAPALPSPVGLLPRKQDINVQGLDLAPNAMDELLTVDPAVWREEVKDLREFYAKFDRLPDALREQLDALERRLGE